MLLGCPSECTICENPSSCQSCSDGFYLNGDICLICQNACKTCYGPTNNDCNSCSSGCYSSPISPHVCQETCPIGYYPNTLLLTCIGIIIALFLFLIIQLFRMSSLLRWLLKIWCLQKLCWWILFTRRKVLWMWFFLQSLLKWCFMFFLSRSLFS